jgi:protein-S-isoprenylcysteine O-methyltransferase Ste14
VAHEHGKHGINLPPTYFLMALVLMALLHYAIPLAQILVAPYRYAGFVIMALGIALGLWALQHFRRVRTGIIPFSPATALVTSGPYRFTRNPMYLGMAGTLLGAALFMGSLTPFIVIPAFMAVIAERFIAPEEAMLERNFGHAYLAFKAKVRRWL